VKIVCTILLAVTMVTLGTRVATAGDAAGTGAASAENCFLFSCFVGDDFVVYFDCYRERHYGAVRSRNLKDWENATFRISFPKGVRHGTVLRVPRAVVAKLCEVR